LAQDRLSVACLACSFTEIPVVCASWWQIEHATASDPQPVPTHVAERHREEGIGSFHLAKSRALARPSASPADHTSSTSPAVAARLRAAYFVRHRELCMSKVVKASRGTPGKKPPAPLKSRNIHVRRTVAGVNSRPPLESAAVANGRAEQNRRRAIEPSQRPRFRQMKRAYPFLPMTLGNMRGHRFAGHSPSRARSATTRHKILGFR
jgi:hypothetical protein